MLVAERLEKIVAIVNERGSIRVSELSEICKVTEETIRRDLDKLEQAGRLMRSHGGAVSLKGQQPETPYTEREILHKEEKMRIAEKAILMIGPGDKIILDASTTAWYMASIMPDIPLTVVTNSMKVAMELATKEKIQVISTGGILAPTSLSFVGHRAEMFLDAYYVNKAFISCKGIHVERGISESNDIQAMMKKKMIKSAEKTILLVDSSKFGTQAFAHFADLHQVDEVITDEHVDNEQVQYLLEKSVKVTIAK